MRGGDKPSIFQSRAAREVLSGVALLSLDKSKLRFWVELKTSSVAGEGPRRSWKRAAQSASANFQLRTGFIPRNERSILGGM